jgi:hypothetical protein
MAVVLLEAEEREAAIGKKFLMLATVVELDRRTIA